MNFILLVGPPAVGKMTIGQELRQQLGYSLFHNHSSIEFALELFPYGSQEFRQLNGGIRELVFRTYRSSTAQKGLIHTKVWDYDRPEDWEYVNGLKQQFTADGWLFYIVELFAPLEVLLKRNTTENRLKHKASKRDSKKSRERLIQAATNHRLHSHPGEMDAYSYLYVDTTTLETKATAQKIINYFRL